MNISPAYSFIKERIELEFQMLEKDKVTPWVFLLTRNGLQVTDFFEKPISYQGVEFEGTTRHVFWNGFIQPFIKDIVSRNFSATRDFCQKHSVDSNVPLEETASLLKARIRHIYRRMVDIDQRLRGQGFPNAVPKYDAKAEIEESEAFIAERLSAEIALVPRKRKNLNTIYEEQKFWFWSVGFAVTVVGLLLKIL